MNTFYNRYIKRVLDVTAAILLLTIFLPVMVIVALLLWLSGHKPVYFAQPRIGLNNKTFTVYKFKTMNDKKDGDGKLLPDEQRLTRIGSVIRKSSLDELPQLINVLKGDMSLIGPRPLLVQYLPLYSAEQRRRHLVRPGITGWAQVNGRNAISWHQKFKFDQWYVDNIGFMLDCRILWLTVLNTLRAKGINQEGQATIRAFTGKESE